MDGNGRWAEERGFPRVAGHEKGAQAFVRCVKDFSDSSLEVLTVYVFSTENAAREKSEVASLFGIIAYFLENQIKPFAALNGIAVRFIGNMSLLPAELVQVADDIISETLNCTRKTLVIALGYGGDDEVTRAVARIGEMRWFDSEASLRISKEELYAALDTAGIPDPDAVLRYGGMRRLSNFLHLQTRYSELFFIDKKWPDYTFGDIADVMDEYLEIKRNFGG